MFKLQVSENKDVLQLLFAISPTWIFDKRQIRSKSKERFAYCVWTDKSIQVNERTINDVQEMAAVLKSKTTVKVTMNPESGHIILRSPLQSIPPIPIIESEEMEADDKTFYETLMRLSESRNVFKDHYEKVHKVVRYDPISNTEFLDMIQFAGDCENLDFHTAPKLTAVNSKTGKKVSLPNIISDRDVRIRFGREAQDFLKFSLIGDKSSIIIADQILILVVNNKCQTLIAGKSLEA